MWVHFLHYFLHFVAILGIAYWYRPEKWRVNYLLLLLTMLIDLDHLWANPIFDPNRCSIGYHLFHDTFFITIYITTLLVSKNYFLRLISLGLVFHIFTDGLDCFLNETW